MASKSTTKKDKAVNSTEKQEEVVKTTTKKDEVVKPTDTKVKETDVKKTPDQDADAKEESTNKSKIVTGYVTGCGRLRVRKAASAKSEVLELLDNGKKVKINMDGSTDSFYNVILESGEGFCMKKFLEV